MSRKSARRALSGESFVALTLSFVSLALFVAVDLLRSFPSFPAVVFLGVAMGFMVLAVPLAHAAGRRRLRGFRLWQPFRGGVPFIVLQAFGWGFFGVAILASLMALSNLESVPFDGVLSAIGGCGFAAHALVAASLAYFDASADHLHPEALHSHGELRVSRVLAFGGTAILVAVDLFARSNPEFPSLLVSSIAVLSLLLSVVIAHAFVGPRIHVGYQVWQPFHGGSSFVLLQSAGWTLFGATILFAIIAATNGYFSTVTGSSRILYAPTAVGVLGLAANASIVASIQHFDPKSSSSDLWTVSEASARTGLSWTGELIVSLLMSLTSAILFIAMDVFLFFGQTSASLFYILGLCAVLSHILGAPLAHAAGTALHKDYKLFQPFEGGPRFVLLQAFGFALYAVTILVSVILVPAADKTETTGLFFALAVVVAFSHSLVLSSLSHFQPGAALSKRTGDDGAMQTDLLDQKSTVLTGETLVAVLVAVGGSVLMVLADAERHDPSFPSHVVYAFGIIGSVCSAAFTHAVAGPAIHGPSFRLWQPFVGGMRYVALSATGWALFAISLMASLVIAFQDVAAVPINGLISAVAVLLFISVSLLIFALPYYFDEDAAGGEPSVPTSAAEMDRELALLTLSAAKEAQALLAKAGDDSGCVAKLQAVQTALEARLADPGPAEGPDVAELAKARASDADAGPFAGDEHAEWSGEVVVGFILASGAVLLFVIVDLIKESSAAAIPLAYVATLTLALGPVISHMMGPTSGYLNKLIWNPFSAGEAFLLLQGLGWSLYGMAVMSSASVLLYGIERVTFHGLCTGIAITGFVGEILLLRSFDYFSPSDRTPSPGPMSPGATGSLTAQPFSQALRNLKTVVRKCLLSDFLALGGMALLLIVDVLVHGGVQSRALVPFMVVGSVAVAFATPLAHFLGGHHTHPTYSVWQPLVGGTRFVLFQAVAWSLYSISVILLMVLLHHATTGKDMMRLPAFAGSTGLLAQVLVLASLQFFDAPIREDQGINSPSPSATPRVVEFEAGVEDTRTDKDALSKAAHKAAHLVPDRVVKRRGEGKAEAKGKETKKAAAAAAEVDFGKTPEPRCKAPAKLSLRGWLAYLDSPGTFTALLNREDQPGRASESMLSETIAGAIAGFFYSLHLLILWIHVFVVWLCVYVAGSFVNGILLFASLLALYAYRASKPCPKYPGYYPTETGSQANEAFRNNRKLWDWMASWFSLRVIMCEPRESQKHIKGINEQERPVTFGFHPHGIYPYTCVWGTLTTAWRSHFPDLKVDGLGSAILFRLPLVREFGLSVGCRDVTKTAIKHALSHGRSIILVPGGQREMVETTSKGNKVVLVTRHKGFIRESIKNNAVLAPIFSFGEHLLFDNVRAPAVQRWFSKIIGFPFPHFPYAYFLTPFPRPAPLTMVVGHPIELKHSEHPDPAYVDEIHAQYFAEVRRLFELHKDEAGYPDYELVFKE